MVVAVTLTNMRGIIFAADTLYMIQTLSLWNSYFQSNKRARVTYETI